jgi:hypothetical protein
MHGEPRKLTTRRNPYVIPQRSEGIRCSVYPRIRPGHPLRVRLCAISVAARRVDGCDAVVV